MQCVFAWREMAVLAAPGPGRERNHAYLLELSDRVEVERQQVPRALNVFVPHWKQCDEPISFFVLELPKVRRPDYLVILIFPLVLEHAAVWEAPALPVPVAWFLCCRGLLASPHLRPGLER